MSDPRADVFVLGGGPAGLAAAASAVAAGARVVLADNNPAPGGQIWRANRGVSPYAAEPWLAAIHAVELWRGATVIDAVAVPGSGHQFTIVQDGRVRSLAASATVLATGARERFIPFPGWTSTGVLGVGGIQAFAKQGLEVDGVRVLIAGSGPLLLAVAQNLRRRGAKIIAIVEQAPRARVLRFGLSLVTQPKKLLQAVRLKASLVGVPQLFDTWPVNVTRGWGAKQPKSKLGGELQVELMRANGSKLQLGADLLATGFGLVPDARIAQYLGCSIEHGAVVVDDMQESSVSSIYAAGESTGIGGVDVALIEGRIAGFAAAGAADKARQFFAARRHEHGFSVRLEKAFALRDELRSVPRDDTIVCRCEDARWGELRRAETMRGAKLQTRCSMGPCQGRVCGPALEFLTGVQAECIRPPFEPVAMDLLT